MFAVGPPPPIPAVVFESEANNTTATADLVSIPVSPILQTSHDYWQTVRGSISSTSDIDYFKFTLGANAGVFLDIDSRETGLSTTLNSVVEVYNSSLALIGSNDDGYDFEGFAARATPQTTPWMRDSSLYLDLTAGDYYIKVNGASSTTGDYDLRLLADTNYASAVPLFHSRPTAADTLYLDFDGHSSTGVYWGAYTAAAYDISGDAATWSPAEQLAIRNVWRLVAEKYSPFEINITTQAPASFANGVGFRQVITNSSPSIVDEGPNTFGVAGIGSYADYDTEENTAFTFASNIASWNSDYGGGVSGKIMAAAMEMGNTSAHEFGHALGLEHYNTDDFPNAIMAQYTSGISRRIWRHEPDLYGTDQDDLAVISSTTNTFGYRPDDVGNSTASASGLLFYSYDNLYSSSGVIHDTADVDYFRFTLGGPVTIRADVDDYVNNLDVVLRLYNSSGALLATHDPATSFDAIISSTLAAGTYYVAVSSNGDYSEVGQYSLSVHALPDIRMLSARGGGNATVTVTYEITQAVVAPFDLRFRLGSGTTLDTVTISDWDDRQIGVHTKTFALGTAAGQVVLPGAGVTETDNEYVIQVVADPDDRIAEVDPLHTITEDNTTVLTGVYRAADKPVQVHGGASDDTVDIRPGATTGSLKVTYNGTEYVYATSPSSVRLRLHGGADRLTTDAAITKPIWVHGGEGNDVLATGAGADTLIGDYGLDSLSGGGGADSLTGGGGDDTLNGGAANDTYRFDADSTLGADTITDSSGTDKLDFSATALGVTLDLGAATAQVVNSYLTLTLPSASGIENLVGGGGADTLTGNALANQITGGAGDDTLSGASGNDKFLFDTDSQLGADTLNDSGGEDILDFSGTTTRAINVDLNSVASQTVNANLRLTLGSAFALEVVRGGTKDDIIRGNGQRNVLLGMAGNDQLYGRDHRDILIGGAGADTLHGDGGEDLLISGATSYDANDAALVDLLWAWGHPYDDYATRVSKLRSGTGVPKLVAGNTVKPDPASNNLYGDSDRDWFFGRLSDIKDKDTALSEEVDAL